MLKYLASPGKSQSQSVHPLKILEALEYFLYKMNNIKNVSFAAYNKKTICLS